MRQRLLGAGAADRQDGVVDGGGRASAHRHHHHHHPTTTRGGRPRGVYRPPACAMTMRRPEPRAVDPAHVEGAGSGSDRADPRSGDLASPAARLPPAQLGWVRPLPWSVEFSRLWAAKIPWLPPPRPDRGARQFGAASPSQSSLENS